VGYKTHDWSMHTEAMDFTLTAMEENHLNYTIWCYAVTNSEQWGDSWNREDLSIFSKDTETYRNNPGDLHSGGRALDAVTRTYAYAIAGIPLTMRFGREKAVFHLTFTTERNEGPTTTEIFVPAERHYPDGYFVEVTDGTFTIRPLDEQGKSVVVLYKHDRSMTQHTVEITRGRFTPRVKAEESINYNGVACIGKNLQSAFGFGHGQLAQFIDDAAKGRDLQDMIEAQPNLVNAKADFHLRGYTALHAAARNEHPYVVQQLLKHKADPTVKDMRGRTALDWAKAKHHRNTVGILQDYDGWAHEFAPRSSRLCVD